MKILVTGAGDFIGQYLVARLKKDGHDVFEHRSADGDLTDRHSLDVYGDVDAVYHLAARTFVPESWELPYEYINDNTRMLTTVLDFCRKHKAGLVYLSTYLYGEPQYLPVDENHRCTTATPYQLSKRIAEEICEFYSRNFDVNVAVIRPFNVYGKGQSREFLLPKVYDQVADPTVDNVEVFTLAPKRDYVYVEDLTDALVRILLHMEGYAVYNVGSGRSYSVKEVIDVIQKEYGTEKPVIEKGTLRKNEVMDCIASISHLEDVIGKLSITSIEDGIHKWHMLDEKN